METFEEPAPRAEEKENKLSRDERQTAVLNQLIKEYAGIPDETRRRLEARFAAQ